VLGCTHYPFLRPLIEQVAGPNVAVIDPAPAVARELVRRLEAGVTPEAREAREGSESFWSSGPLAHARLLIPALWGRAAQVLALPC
jgi:glutamate racemase